MAEAHEVAPRGDVKLICLNDANEEGTLIIVSSVVLRMGSPVFEAMLGPHFKEGQTLTGGARLELPLPDDEAASMLTMCQVMHMKAVTAVPESSEEMLKLAILVDKYDCKITLSYPISKWMQKADVRKSHQDRINLLTTAYLLRLQDDFAGLGKDIVLQSDSRARSHQVFYTDEKLQKVIDVLNQQRAKLVRGAVRFLENTIAEECAPSLPSSRTACEADCTYHAIRSRDFMTMLCSHILWPPTLLLDETPKYICEALRDDLPDWSSSAKFCKGVPGKECKYTRMDGVRDVMFNIKNHADEIERHAITPCLQCVLDGQRLGKRGCRENHGIGTYVSPDLSEASGDEGNDGF